ncbi:MAG: ATP-binding cassette domain-containing protein [Aquamicrobium sp.]|nr:ATP-binding cassette domain-containing protein [Aquamicrobium sp.]
MDKDSARTREALLELKDVTFSAGAVLILKPVSLALRRGVMTGVIGPNGSGKSSLVRLIARQQKPSSGEIRLAGRPLDDFRDRELAREIAYLPQFTPPAEGMTVRELVALGRFPWHGALGRFGPQDAAKVESALERTDLSGLADRLVDSLSGGERQRAWLAMMLAQDTSCLILDEPTSALDIAHQAEMLALVHMLTREHELSALVVLHDINMAARYCDELIAIKDGEVVARGAPQVIVEPETLGKLYGLPMGILPHPGTGQPLSFVS